MKRILFSLMLAVSLSLIGCSGSDGANGANGATGETGANGSNGADGQDLLGPFSANKFITVKSWALTDANTASFQILDGSTPITNLTKSNLTVYRAELVPGAAGGSDEWKMLVTEAYNSDPAKATNGTLDTTNSATGLYKYTLNSLPSGTTQTEANIQRIVLRITNLTGFRGVNKSYDYMTSTPTTEVTTGNKDVVTTEACNKCHGIGITIHSQGRNDTKTCVLCHSPNYNADIATHEADMVTMVHQIHTNKATTLGALHMSGHGENWPSIKYPGNILDCVQCHAGTQGDNWKNKPTRAACDSCHTTIKFDNTAYDGIKSGTADGQLHNQTGDSNCVTCHSADSIATKHTVTAPSSNPALRTLTATITAAAVNATTGAVTVDFTLANSGSAVNDLLGAGGTVDTAKYSKPSFGLMKLVKNTLNGQYDWVSYTARCRTKDAAKAPVLQSNTENTGTTDAVDAATGKYRYTFALANGSTAGDIRTIVKALNTSSGLTPTTYNGSVMTECSASSTPAYSNTVIAYNSALTHRVGMSIGKVNTAGTIEANASFDFVPDTTITALPATRNIVDRTGCDNCHEGKKIHAGYKVEYCVMCHNTQTSDPYSGNSVALQVIAHKIHMGPNLGSVAVDGGTYRINATATATTGHIYTNAQYPRSAYNSTSTTSPTDCLGCHVNSTTTLKNATNWKTIQNKEVCGTCHDSSVSLAHMELNITGAGKQACGVCHAEGKLTSVVDVHLGK